MFIYLPTNRLPIMTPAYIAIIIQYLLKPVFSAPNAGPAASSTNNLFGDEQNDAVAHTGTKFRRSSTENVDDSEEDEEDQKIVAESVEGQLKDSPQNDSPELWAVQSPLAHDGRNAVVNFHLDEDDSDGEFYQAVQNNRFVLDQ